MGQTVTNRHDLIIKCGLYHGNYSSNGRDTRNLVQSNSGAETSRSLDWRCIWMVSGTVGFGIMLCCHICTWSGGLARGGGFCMAQFGISVSHAGG